MTDESSAFEPTETLNTTSREKLRKAAALRAEAAQKIASAQKIEAREAKQRKDDDIRDFRIVGMAVMGLVQKDPTLARTILEGIGSATVSIHDRKHLAREDSAFVQLQRIVDGKSPLPSFEQPNPTESAAENKPPERAPDTAWFVVPYAARDKLPPGVRYDPETKLRFAPTRVLVEEMRGLRFDERRDLAGKPFHEPK